MREKSIPKREIGVIVAPPNRIRMHMKRVKNPVNRAGL